MAGASTVEPMNAAIAAVGSPPLQRTFFGHPRGLAYIVFAEGWERFSFYGMQALLVLYMTGQLLKAGSVENIAGFASFRSLLEGVLGPLSTQALASQIFGLYIALVYFFPILGGLIGDRLTGRTRAVIAGAGLMAIGHFLMVFESAFLVALAALIFGSGLLKGNLAAQVGDLYDKSDSRRDSAFSMYCLAINVGAFVAPLVCGTLGELYGWHYGFGVAGIGMLVGIAIYMSGRVHLPPDRITSKAAAPVQLQPGDVSAIVALAGVIGIVALYWIGQTQVWNTYPLYLRDHVDRGLFGFDIPVTWFQSFDTAAVLGLAPLVIWYWRRQSKRGVEPKDLTKIAAGCAAFAIGCALLSVGAIFSGDSQVSILWPLAFHFVCAFGYLYTWPITLTFVSRAAPAAVNAMLVGATYLSMFLGGLLSGWLGRFYETLSPAQFWSMHGAIVGCGTVLILFLRGPLLRVLRISNIAD